MSNIDKLKPGKYAVLFRNNWDGEGDTYETFAILDAEGIWRDEDGDELLEYQGDEVLKAWPLDDGSDVLALLDELEAAEKRIAELEARKVNFSLPAELTVEDCDVLARPIEYGTGWNLAISSCEEKFIQALNAAGIRIDRED
ncbi:ead/Ea22-like family protein [Enterobacter roggenkampii]|uniref:ead/Ea22-like family protein n=1 Tax=Enterobacter roggenkampii TaxID=1812935 RepID=UPI0020061D7D|nr:ead/Ea22-like family protein [Enterobacter roggenkampii]MCK6949278.1 ead/Ea22-like family protein [Enterobacter roggenkampii]